MGNKTRSAEFQASLFPRFFITIEIFSRFIQKPMEIGSLVVKMTLMIFTSCLFFLLLFNHIAFDCFSFWFEKKKKKKKND